MCVVECKHWKTPEELLEIFTSGANSVDSASCRSNSGALSVPEHVQRGSEPSGERFNVRFPTSSVSNSIGFDDLCVLSNLFTFKKLD